MEVYNYITLKFKCSYCKEGQYYSKGEVIQCPYCEATDGQILTEVEYAKAQGVNHLNCCTMQQKG